MGLVMLIDIRNGEIVKVDSTLSTRLSEGFLSSILVGRNICSIEDIVADIEAVYQGNAQRAIISGLQIIYSKYMTYLEKCKSRAGHIPKA